MRRGDTVGVAGDELEAEDLVARDERQDGQLRRLQPQEVELFAVFQVQQPQRGELERRKFPANADKVSLLWSSR